MQEISVLKFICMFGAAAASGYSAQPMASAGQAVPAGGSDGSNFNAGRGASAEQSLGGLTGVAINLLNGRRLQQLDVRP